MERRRRVLVTGGAGFIGSHLCERLLNDGNDVICADSFFSGAKENVIHLLSNPYFELLRHDVRQPLYTEVDQIYHLACPASPVHYQHSAIATMKTNVIGTINMCGLAKRCGATLLLASTSEVYGDPLVHPQPESYQGNVSCVGLRACYDEGKRCAETICMDYMRQHNTKVRIARIFNTYGPRMFFRDGRVVSNFIVQALRNDPLTIYGDGSQTRSFCFISDLIDGLIALMSSDITGPCNLGNPHEFTVMNLASMITKETGASSVIEYRELPSDDPTCRQPDITLAKRRLGWSPKVSLSDGLVITVNDFKQRALRNPVRVECVHQNEAVPKTPTGACSRDG
eukprot:GHVR01030391.1.p1 GENE.GHVR01030391.1~~GHVR01030391.1.p1  ORF type:complete len:340 (+),score=50.09 GHVR01030391.1:53-1072(+)